MVEKNNKTKIIAAVIGAVIAIAGAIVAVVLIKNSNKQLIGDDFFVSNDKKLVITIDADENEFGATKQYQVYNYKGNEDAIEDAYYYYEFVDADKAKSTYESSKDSLSELGDHYSDVHVEGKYIVLKVNPKEYEGVKPSLIKQAYEEQKRIQETGEPSEIVEDNEETLEEPVEEQLEEQSEEQPIEEEPAEEVVDGEDVEIIE